MQRTLLNLSYDQQPINELSLKNLDMEKIHGVFKKVGRKSDEQKMRSLGILAETAKGAVPSIGGMILFGKGEDVARLLSDAKVRCARFLGIDKVNILDQYDVEGTILDAVQQVPKFIGRNTRLTAEFTRMQRRDIPEYSPVAVREVLINALVHCDYSISGTSVQVAVFEDRLEIQNPGMLPFGFTIEDLKSGVSRVRNRVIARVFSELRLIEAWGSGYKRVVEACLSEGYPEPKWEELGTAIRVTLFPHPQSQLQDKSGLRGKASLTAREEKILDCVKKKKEISSRKIAEFYNLAGRTVSHDLAALEKKGLVERNGKGRATVWREA